MSSEKKCTKIKIIVKCVTGNEVNIEVDQSLSVDSLKDVISRQLNLPIDSFSIQSNYKQLIDGNLLLNEIEDLSEIIVMPVIKSGLRMRYKIDETDEVTNSISDKMIRNFFAGKSCLSFNAKINNRSVLVSLKFNSVDMIAEKKRKLMTRRGRRKSQMPRQIKPKMFYSKNDDYNAEQLALRDLQRSIKTLFNVQIPKGSMFKITLAALDETDNESLENIEVLTVLDLLNSILSEMIRNESTLLSSLTLPTVTMTINNINNTTGIQPTPREELVQKMKTHATMQKLLKELRQRKLKRQKSTD